MFKVYNCLANEHDLRLVLLAAAICVLASFAALTLLQHARKANTNMKLVWICVSAISTGFGIWATHFIGMLAFSPGLHAGYDINLTIVSLIAAISLTGCGLLVAILNFPFSAWVGGAMVGGGIAAMHYLGMAAFRIEGIILWDRDTVVASIVFGVCIGAIALPVGLKSKTFKEKAIGAGLLTLAICALHFTAMGAVTTIELPSISMPSESISREWLALAVAAPSFAVLLLALGAVALDIRDQRRSALEADRMRSLADAAVEGLLVCDGETAITVNHSFATLVGSSSEKLAGSNIETFIPDVAVRTGLFANPNHPIEANLRHIDGSLIPVEMILRGIDFGGKPHHVVAVRNLQARKKAEQHIHYLAHHDALTGLPNRVTFNERLDREIAACGENKKLAVVYLDLDRFKEVNDLFGHAAGDNVLKAVAARIPAILGKDGMLSRLGGDEFAMVVPNLNGPNAAGRIAEEIIAALRGPLDGEESISCSIGIAMYPDDADNSEALLSHADTALYRAKNDGRATYRFFEAKMGSEVRDRRLLEHDLRQAIPNGELALVYQPQEGIRSQTTTGFEALLRWNHKTRGPISPAVFIPIAEESGAIVAIGEWVLREACREAASWKRPLAIAVNVSAVQLYTDNFVQLVHGILLETGLSPYRLELEITETALVRDFNRALAALRQLKALGISIAMDDFGTGYSSLSNLRAFPFDKIKIDGSFIKSVHTNAQAATIVRAVLGLGRGLGLPVLAEGVETSAELRFLQTEFCDEVQGYFVGRPASIETFATLTGGEEIPTELAKTA